MSKKVSIILIVALLTVAVIMAFILILNNIDNGVGTAGISEDEFEEIQVGETTNFALNNIIDKNDEWNDDNVYNKCVEKISEEKESQKYTYVYKYYGEKSGYALITLQADYSNGYFYNDVIVIKKEKFNLK